MGKSVKRLFSEFKPKHYILEIAPDKDSMVFEGQVIIRGQKTGRPSKRLTFHQNGLKITAAHVVKHDKTGDQEVKIDRINPHDKFDEVRLHTPQMLYPGQYTIHLEFTGKIARQMNGLYPCFFTHDDKEKMLLATQFESHHAREVFPCIDEPEAKASFQLTLTHPADEVALSNTPIATQEKVDSKNAKTTFEPTPHMSTYLLAFVVGEMGYKEAKTKNGVHVRTYSTPDNVQFTEFALEVAVKSLEFYNDYFGIDYPLKKCDMIALPDFASGAMENWGCITYREQTLLVDPVNSSLTNKQYVAMVVAHELAHMWFGNLVTMRWWTDLWLNEGFASWIEYLAVDHLFPEWQMWTQFAVDEQHRALKLDALEYTHPVEVAVNHPDEIRTIFDTISYSKGASVIHMLNDYLSPETFRDGLRHYLQSHKYGNTDTVDLWAALEEISGKPVREFMHAWTSQSGYPILSAEISQDKIELKQERFYLNPEHTKDKTMHWPIALLAAHPALPELITKNEEFEISDAHGLKLNRGQSGFYRVAYNATHLERLGELIRKGRLSALDRLGILSDVFETAKAGKTDTAQALHFLENFQEEDDSAVWDVIAASISSVRAAMDDEDLREDMKPFIRKLTAKQLKRLGWEPRKDESHFDQLLRPLIIGLNASADEPTVVNEALERFAKMKSPEDIHPDLRSVIYATAVRHGNAKTFDKLFKLHEASTLSEERTTIAMALTTFKQPELVVRALTLIKSESVRLQDVGYWVAYSFMNRFARDATWTWMTKNWAWLGDNLGTDLSFYRFPMYAANAYSNREFLAKFKDFFVPKKSPSFERSINQGIEVLQWQSAWKERDLKEVKAFFKSKK